MQGLQLSTLNQQGQETSFEDAQTVVNRQNKKLQQLDRTFKLAMVVASVAIAILALLGIIRPDNWEISAILESFIGGGALGIGIYSKIERNHLLKKWSIPKATPDMKYKWKDLFSDTRACMRSLKRGFKNLSKL